MGSPRPMTALVPAMGLEFVGIPGLPSVGKVFFVKPYSGSNSNSGRRPDRAMQTLAGALAKCTAGHNDIVYLIAESNTAGSTTDYQTAVLDWNVDSTHLIGVNPGSFIGQRSRIGWASTTAVATATELFRLSANNCLIANVEIFQGLASGTSMLGAMSVTGKRNKVYGCQISGMGHADNVIANAYSLHLNGAEENVFERCYIGLDTIPRATDTTSELRLSAGAIRNMFMDCTFVSQIGHATFSPFVYFNGATAIDRWLHFKRCTFMNFAANYGFTQTVAMKHSATPTQGVTFVEQSSCIATNWAAAGNKVYLTNEAINTAYTGGTGYTS
jgi:hypothetical protein